MPVALNTQPATIGHFGPLRATHRPEASEPSTIATAIGANKPAICAPE